jgi:hypothetical protein
MEKFNPLSLLNEAAQAIMEREPAGSDHYNLIYRDGHFMCIPFAANRKIEEVLFSLKESEIRDGLTTNDWNIILHKIGQRKALIIQSRAELQRS